MTTIVTRAGKGSPLTNNEMDTNLTNLNSYKVEQDISGNATITGDVYLTGSGKRITGDFSNATVANRVMFQTSTVNDQTSIGVLPNGTASTSTLLQFNNSDPTNSGFGGIQVTSSLVNFLSGITGTGTYLPMTFYTGGSERMRIDTSGNVVVDGNNLKLFSTKSLAANGYQKLPSGLIIQWGTTNTAVAANTSTSMTWTFPIAFPNACLFATASPGNFVASSHTSESWTTTSAAGFAQHSSAQTLKTLWFAIGN